MPIVSTLFKRIYTGYEIKFCALNLPLIKQYSINGAFSDQMFRDSKMVGPKPLGMK